MTVDLEDAGLTSTNLTLLEAVAKCLQSDLTQKDSNCGKVMQKFGKDGKNFFLERGTLIARIRTSKMKTE